MPVSPSQRQQWQTKPIWLYMARSRHPQAFPTPTSGHIEVVSVTHMFPHMSLLDHKVLWQLQQDCRIEQPGWGEKALRPVGCPGMQYWADAALLCGAMGQMC